MNSVLRAMAIAWALLGILALLARPLVSLTPIAIESLSSGLVWWQWGIAAAWVCFMAYAEGYRGFQGRFSPMFAARVDVLRREPTVLRGLLAPMFCMGLFDATRRRLAVSWGVLLAVVLLVVVVRFLPQPWRGIVDLGVVVGLTWGGISLIAHVAWTLWTGRAAADPCLATAGAVDPAP